MPARIVLAGIVIIQGKKDLGDGRGAVYKPAQPHRSQFTGLVNPFVETK